jgi:myo-inositol-1(or 4)-monophosphatase
VTRGAILDRAGFAEEVAGEAAALARELFARHERKDTRFKNPQEHLTNADEALERLIVERLRRRFPDDGVVGEEGARAHGAGLWVIDPIDGTANFAHGLPHFGISIAYVKDGCAECGVVAAPMAGEIFVAARGAGARLGAARLRVSDAASLCGAHVEIGWNLKDRVEEFTAAIRNVAAQGAGMIRAGSAALALAHVAAGRLDGYCEQHVYAWDVCAGMLLVEEAGGRVNTFFAHAKLEAGGPILAAPPQLYADLSRASGIA